MRNLTRYGLIAAVVIVAVVITIVVWPGSVTPPAQARLRPDFGSGVPNGPNGPIIPIPPLPCRLTCSMLIIFPGVAPIRTTISGTALSQNVGFSDQRDPIASTTENIISLIATGDDPAFGTVTTTLDTTRKASPTIITANQKGRDFPATGKINFNAEIRLGSRPGSVFQSVEEIQIEDRNLKSLRPHVKANYRMLRPVRFVDVNRRDSAGFMLSDLNVAIN